MLQKKKKNVKRVGIPGKNRGEEPAQEKGRRRRSQKKSHEKRWPTAKGESVPGTFPPREIQEKKLN